MYDGRYSEGDGELGRGWGRVTARPMRIVSIWAAFGQNGSPAAGGCVCEHATSYPVVFVGDGFEEYVTDVCWR